MQGQVDGFGHLVTRSSLLDLLTVLKHYKLI
jgi:hypothetical protein